MRATPQMVLAASVALVLALVVQHAAVYEDAYITFRVADNFIRDGVLSWALDERVQPSTTILWMLLHIPLYYVWNNIYAITLLLGFACTLVALAAPLATARRPAAECIALFLLPLSMSEAFIKYSTSGFENSLQHALFALFGLVLWRGSAHPRYWFLLSLLAMLSVLNRFDAVLFYAPVGLVLLATGWRTIRWRQAILGALPLVVWLAFSLFYYGFAFPNSRYAKLASNITLDNTLELGRAYWLNLWAVDTVSALAMLAGVVLAMDAVRQPDRQRRRESLLLLGVSLGISTYVAYVVMVGGTYLGGRFFSLPIYASCWLILMMRQRVTPLGLVVLCTVPVAIRLWMPPPEEANRKWPGAFYGVNQPHQEERLRLADVMKGHRPPQPRSTGWHSTPVEAGSIGVWGYAMKPEIKIVDFIAIGDPLLARLPNKDKRIHSTGIMPRQVPAGYLAFLKTGDMSRMPPELVPYYSKLRYIISGNLWDGGRVVEVFRFNRGDYDGYLKDYLEKRKHYAPKCDNR